VDIASGDVLDVGWSSASKTAFQLVSLDDDGAALVWTATEMAEGDQAGSEVDLGLAIGSRVKLLRSTVLRQPNVVDRAVALTFKPDDTNEFLVGCASTGIVQRARRFGTAPTPCLYANSLLDAPIIDHHQPSALSDAVSVITYSPFFPAYFLVGFLSGTICLFHVSSAQPVSVWVGACVGGVTTLVWSPYRSSCFVALSTGGPSDSKTAATSSSGMMRVLQLWDLSRSEQAPLHVLSLPPATDDVPAVTLSHRTGALTTGMLALTNGSVGTVDVHVLPFATTEEADRKLVHDLLSHLH